MIKIFHMADLHLDSPFSGGDIRRSENGRNRLRNVFRRMIKHINERGYDLVLVPGDLYDGGFVTEETAELIRSSFASLSCPVVISPGNHDPYVKGSIYSAGGFSDNVHIFNSEKAEKIDFDNIGVSVWGYAFCSSVLRSNPIADIDTESGRINILCAHADANSPLSPYAPIKYSEMEEAGFTYAALGHIHRAPSPYVSERCTAAYTGFAEGRGFDEIGGGGALSVTIFETGEYAEVKPERLNFSEYSFEILPVSVDGALNSGEMAIAVMSAIENKGYGKNNAVRAVLEGVLSADITPDTDEIKRKCASAVDYLEVKDRTLPTEDDKVLMRDMTLRGEFYRLMKKKLDEGEDRERAAAALRIGLAALASRELSVFLVPDESGEEA